MKFSSEVFMAAVLGIFRSRKVMAAGGDVPLRVLREDWSGVGLRAGANVGYLSYTQKQSWFPF